MLNLLRQILTSFSLVSFMFLLPGCDTGTKAVKAEYDNYRFDQQVIDKLPLYDSLVMAIKANFPAFNRFIKDDDSYRAFRYRPASDDPEVFIKLPPAAVPGVTPCYNRLGKDFIFGFDVFKDSSVKILVRKKRSPGTEVDITEYLSYYNRGNIRDRVFPEKDSTLNKNWQYWAWFGKQFLF